MKKNILFITIILFLSNTGIAQEKIPDYSKAGFYEIPGSGRKVYNFNVGWRFFKGVVKGAEQNNFNDSDWNIVNTPHGLELLSTQASGSSNYQGEAWYRKHFIIPESVENKRLIIYFEAVMGKSKVWLNGELLASHYGGYLPFSIDISKKIIKGKENVLVVWADNSNDTSYPPGKSQQRLDFCYFGGIYRDVWLIATNKIYITDPNQEDKISGGGTFVHYEDLSEEKVNVVVQTDIASKLSSKQQISIKYILKDTDGKIVL
ncbi:MAG: glycoside hydrolase family 2 protein, partial [Flavobacteriia bacterium]